MDTPETDALNLAMVGKDDSEYLIALDTLSCRLERERDKARSLFKSSKHARQSLSDACDHLQRRLAEMAEQRDKWQEEAMKWRDICAQAITNEELKP